MSENISERKRSSKQGFQDELNVALGEKKKEERRQEENGEKEEEEEEMHLGSIYNDAQGNVLSSAALLSSSDVEDD